MTIHGLTDPPPDDLARALAEFERQFTYPLGPGRLFRIEHGDDYPRFYRSIGEARCFVAEERGRALGVVCAALRPVVWPDGGERLAGYLGDLKTTWDARYGLLLLDFLKAAEAWGRPRAAEAFGVVMDGTRTTPNRYSGKAGIPLFTALGKTMVFRFPIASTRPAAEDGFTSIEGLVRDLYRRLAVGRFACPVGTPAERSVMAPVWLAAPDGSACGCLEDTRRAKRLVTDDGAEMVSAHLSSLAYRTPEAGAAVIRAALARAAALGYPALFVAVPATDADAVSAALGGLDAVRAPATVYGHGFPQGHDWLINSSEI